MLNRYQRRLLLSYIANAADRLGRRHPVMYCDLIADNGLSSDARPMKFDK